MLTFVHQMCSSREFSGRKSDVFVFVWHRGLMISWSFVFKNLFPKTKTTTTPPNQPQQTPSSFPTQTNQKTFPRVELGFKMNLQ